MRSLGIIFALYGNHKKIVKTHVCRGKVGRFCATDLLKLDKLFRCNRLAKKFKSLKRSSFDDESRLSLMSILGMANLYPTNVGHNNKVEPWQTSNDDSLGMS